MTQNSQRWPKITEVELNSLDGNSSAENKKRYPAPVRGISSRTRNTRVSISANIKEKKNSERMLTVQTYRSWTAGISRKIAVRRLFCRMRRAARNSPMERRRATENFPISSAVGKIPKAEGFHKVRTLIQKNIDHPSAPFRFAIPSTTAFLRPKAQAINCPLESLSIPPCRARMCSSFTSTDL